MVPPLNRTSALWPLDMSLSWKGRSAGDEAVSLSALAPQPVFSVHADDCLSNGDVRRLAEAIGIGKTIKLGRSASNDGGDTLLFVSESALVVFLADEMRRKSFEEKFRTPEERLTVLPLDHALAGVRVCERQSRDLLSKGSFFDFAPRKFPEESCVLTHLDGIEVMVHRRPGASVFDMYCRRSLAVSLLDWLLDAAYDCGYQLAAND